MTQLWYATLRHPKMHPHTKFGIPTSKNIGDMDRTRKRDGHTDGWTVRLLYASQSSFGGIIKILIFHYALLSGGLYSKEYASERDCTSHLGHVILLSAIFTLTVNVLKFRTLFSFCSQIKCWYSGLEFTKCCQKNKQGRP